MVQVLGDPADLPLGCHALSFHSSAFEAEDHAMRFISGSPPGIPAVYFVPDEATSGRYNEHLSDVAPEHVGCVMALGHEQVESVGGVLRPAREVRAFFETHQDGVTAGGDTMSMYLEPETVPAHLEYECWFDDQPRNGSRFICPYDLRRVPVDQAAEMLHELGQHHSHVVLSSSAEPAVRLLQLFIFGSRAEVPSEFREQVQWADDQHLIEEAESEETLRLTPEGRDIVSEWSGRTTVDW